MLVTGASGFVGSHVTRALTRQGRRVRVLLRATSRTEALAGLGVEVVHGDVLDPDSLRAAMAGCGSVFWNVVDPRFWLSDQAPIWRNNVDGLVHGMDAAQAAGVGRFVFTSTMGTLGIDPARPVTEAVPFNWRDRAPPYILARLAAEERFLARCREGGLPGVALCVANTYGPEDYQPTPHNHMLWQVASGRMKAVMAVGQPTVDIRDVADAALLAEQRGRPGERYIIANAFVQNRDFFAMATAERGTPPPRAIPYPAAYAMAWVAERWLTFRGRRDFLLRTDGVFLANVFRELDNGKARRELGWTPRPVAETVRDAVAWFAEREAASR